MKLKLKLTFKQVFRYVYILLIVINLAALFYVYKFVNTYVYGSVVVDKNYLIMQATQNSGNINIEKFNEIVEKIENKTNR